MTDSIIAIVKDPVQLQACVDGLQSELGVTLEEISVLIPDSGIDAEFFQIEETGSGNAMTDIAQGAGEVIGLLAGVGTLAIPGLGVFIAAGPLMQVLGGAETGAVNRGLAGTLTGLGVSRAKSQVYERKLNGGQYLMAVHASDEKQGSRISNMMRHHDLEDILSVAIVA